MIMEPYRARVVTMDAAVEVSLYYIQGRERYRLAQPTLQTICRYCDIKTPLDIYISVGVIPFAEISLRLFSDRC